jgi:Spy/CpxP family protein refolding chaperone
LKPFRSVELAGHQAASIERHHTSFITLKEQSMNRKYWVAAAVSALFALPLAVQAQAPARDCAMGQAVGAGPGSGCGMGPGMMQGQGMGQGMGHGMGQGMGHGMGQGMGHGMMGGGDEGRDPYAALKLDDAQRAKIHEIRKDERRKRFALMESARDARFAYAQLERAGKADEAAQLKAYDASAGVHKQMFEARLDTRKRIEAVLTPEQREQVGRGRRGGVGG